MEGAHIFTALRAKGEWQLRVWPKHAPSSPLIRSANWTRADLYIHHAYTWCACCELRVVRRLAQTAIHLLESRVRKESRSQSETKTQTERAELRRTEKYKAEMKIDGR